MRLLLLLLSLLIVACPAPRAGDDDDSANDDDSADDDDATPAVQIPNPLDGDEPDRAWRPDRANATPETAWPAGIVTESPFYLESTVPEGADAAWFVFQGGADFHFNVELYDGAFLIESVHLHDGAGLELGALLDLDVDLREDFGGQVVTLDFDVVTDAIYVLEFRVTDSGFF